MADLTAADFEAAGLYDPAAPDAPSRLELLEFLAGLGATVEDLIEYRDELPGLATVVAMRGGGALTLSEAAERADVSEARLRRFYRAAGFPDPGPRDRVLGRELAELAAGTAAAEAVFGEEAVFQLVRVIGASTARLADAIVSAFLANVQPRVRDRDSVGLNVARANAEASALLPTVNAALDVFLRQHIIGARRRILGDAPGFEGQRLSVGFVDLVGSTALAQRLSMRELGAVLATFEQIAGDAVTSRHGRVVKLIGDEVLYTASDEAAACAIGLELAATFADHATVPPVRVGLAAGDVLLRDGDVFGPVVNLAARAVKVAAPGEVVAPAAIAAAAGIGAEPLPRRQLKGFDENIPLCRLVAD